MHSTIFFNSSLKNEDLFKTSLRKNILNSLALTASNLYAKNLLNFIINLYNKDKQDIYINEEDEIINKTLIKNEL